MSYYYQRTEPGLWTVGHKNGDGEFEPESDHRYLDDAVKRVTFLNTGHREADEHDPTFAAQADGRWGVHCTGCSRQAGDYVWPCKKGYCKDYPSQLVDVPAHEKVMAELADAKRELGEIKAAVVELAPAPNPQSLEKVGATWELPSHAVVSEAVAHAVTDDDEPTIWEQHPAFMVLYGLYKYLECPGTVDGSDPEDRACVASASVKALMDAGILTAAESTADGPEQTDERPSKFEIRATTDKGGPCETCSQPRNRHVCLSCSPTGDEPGHGCINCRQTGWDQTPCLPPHRWTGHGHRCCEDAAIERPVWLGRTPTCARPDVCGVCREEVSKMAGHQASSVSAQAEAGSNG